jgi:hypothetical protein
LKSKTEKLELYPKVKKDNKPLIILSITAGALLILILLMFVAKDFVGQAIATEYQIDNSLFQEGAGGSSWTYMDENNNLVIEVGARLPPINDLPPINGLNVDATSTGFEFQLNFLSNIFECQSVELLLDEVWDSQEAGDYYDSFSEIIGCEEYSSLISVKHATINPENYLEPSTAYKFAKIILHPRNSNFDINLLTNEVSFSEVSVPDMQTGQDLIQIHVQPPERIVNIGCQSDADCLPQQIRTECSGDDLIRVTQDTECNFVDSQCTLDSNGETYFEYTLTCSDTPGQICFRENNMAYCKLSGCSDNTECYGTTPICHPETHSCVQCYDDDGYNAASKGTVFDINNLEGMQDSCDGTDYVMEGLCDIHQNIYYVFPLECDSGTICLDGACISGECLSHDDCPNQVCDLENSQCVDCYDTDGYEATSKGTVFDMTHLEGIEDSCDGTGGVIEGLCDDNQNIYFGSYLSCSEGALCLDGACVETECQTDGECTNGVCDLETYQCVQCLAHDDCPNQVCNLENNLCVDCYDTDGEQDYSSLFGSVLYKESGNVIEITDGCDFDNVIERYCNLGVPAFNYIWCGQYDKVCEEGLCVSKEIYCNDLMDNDYDELADCDDPDCATNIACTGEFPTCTSDDECEYSTCQGMCAENGICSDGLCPDGSDCEGMCFDSAECIGYLNTYYCECLEQNFMSGKTSSEVSAICDANICDVNGDCPETGMICSDNYCRGCFGEEDCNAFGYPTDKYNCASGSRCTEKIFFDCVDDTCEFGTCVDGTCWDLDRCYSFNGLEIPDTPLSFSFGLCDCIDQRVDGGINIFDAFPSCLCQSGNDCATGETCEEGICIIECSDFDSDGICDNEDACLNTIFNSNVFLEGEFNGCMKGDVNVDGVINNDDIGYFLSKFSQRIEYYQPADMKEDGSINNDDIGLFLNYFRDR